MLERVEMIVDIVFQRENVGRQLVSNPFDDISSRCFKFLYRVNTCFTGYVSSIHEPPIFP